MGGRVWLDVFDAGDCLVCWDGWEREMFDGKNMMGVGVGEEE